MLKKGFATIIVLIIFIVLSLIVLIVIQKQHTNIDAATQAKFKATSKIAAESGAQKIIDLVTNSAGAGATINLGAVGSTVNITIPATSVNCVSTNPTGIFQYTSGYIEVPANGLCLIGTDTYSLRVIGYSDANRTVKTEVSVGFKKE